MIRELLAIAENEGLTGMEPYRSRPVHWFVELDAAGGLIGLSPTTNRAEAKKKEILEVRGKSFQIPGNYHTQVKEKTTKSKTGKETQRELQGVCTNQHNWLPDFLTGPAAELYPLGADGKQAVRFPKQRQTWHLVFKASRQLPHNRVLKAIVGYLRTSPKFPLWLLPHADEDQKAGIIKRLAEGKETLSFRVNGKAAFRDDEIKGWWADQIKRQRNDVLALLEDGSDFYQGGDGKLAEYFPVVFNSIPFASFDKQPYESYGLGKQTTPFRIETAERAAAGLNWLLNRGNSCRIELGDLTAVFWAKIDQKARPTRFGQLLAQPDSLQVKEFFSSVWSGRAKQAHHADFYAALFSRSPGRFAVRSWHTETLPKAEERLATYLAAILLPQFGEEITFSVSALAGATVHRSKESRPAPNTYVALFETALFGKPLPSRLLTAALLRQRVELAKGADKKNPRDFDDRLAARTAIIKLYFKATKGVDMAPQYGIRSDSAYLCGRLLAMLDKIHVEAHQDSGGTASSPANRAYGAASTTPAMIFPQLCKLTRHHLNKIASKKKAWAAMLELGVSKEKRKDGISEDFEGLAGIVASLLETERQEFPRTLNLEEQGRFAIGFYYERQRCRKWPPTRDPSDKVTSLTHSTDPTLLENQLKGDNTNE